MLSTVDRVGVRPGGSQKHLGVGHSQIAVSVKDTCRAQWAVDDLQNGSVLLLSKRVKEMAEGQGPISVL